MCIIVYSFLATGNSFWTLHTRFQRGASTIPQIVYDVCDSIYQVLQPIYMQPPREDDWNKLNTDLIQNGTSQTASVGYPEGGPLPHCIVVDEAFSLRMDLMRPYPHGKK